MNLNVELTATPTVRSMAEFKNVFREFLAFLSKKCEIGPQVFFGADILVDFGWFLGDLEVF